VPRRLPGTAECGCPERRGGASFGADRPAVVAGHVDWDGRPGVFSKLRDLKPNDSVWVARKDGSEALFRVLLLQEYPKDAFPTSAVYGNIGYAGLRLITCGGSFDRQVHSYRDKIVVFATRGGGAGLIRGF
jgi:hypothetical protein